MMHGTKTQGIVAYFTLTVVPLRCYNEKTILLVPFTFSYLLLLIKLILYYFSSLLLDTTTTKVTEYYVPNFEPKIHSFLNRTFKFVSF